MVLSAKLQWLILLYGIQGIPYGFQVIFLPVLLHSSGTSLTKVSLMRALNIPWMLKLLWAPFVTSSQHVKRPLTFSLGGLAVAFAITSFIPLQSLWILSVSLLLVNILVSIQDIAVDSFAIQCLSSNELGHGNAIQVVAYKFGAMLGGGVLTWASQYLPWDVLIASITCTYCCVALMIHFKLPVELIYNGTLNKSRNDTEFLHQNIKNKQRRTQNTQSKSQRISPPRKQQVPLAEDEHSIRSRFSGHTYNLRSRNRGQTEAPSDVCHRLMISQFSESDHENRDTVSVQKKRTLDRSKATSNHVKTINHNCAELGSNISIEETGFSRSIYLQICKDFEAVLEVANTKWLLFYLLIYKLGEQGAVSIYPLFLLDGKVSTNHIAVWTGVISQWISIGGSLMGGWIMSHSNKKRFSVRLLWLSLWRSLSLVLLALLIHALDPKQNFNYVILCLPFYIVQWVGGAITTATFTLMMTTSQGVDHSPTQTLHHTTMATAEVLGKVFFTALAGLLVDHTGYILGFYCFTLLSVLPVLPLLKINKS